LKLFLILFFTKACARHQKIRECIRATDLIDSAEKLKVPIMLHVVEDDLNQASFVPCSVISTSIVKYKSTAEQNELTKVIKALFEERRNVDLYSYLPDFIEVSEIFFQDSNHYCCIPIKCLTCYFHYFASAAIHLDSFNF
jgi:hypothetical protein